MLCPVRGATERCKFCFLFLRSLCVDHQRILIMRFSFCLAEIDASSVWYLCACHSQVPAFVAGVPLWLRDTSNYILLMGMLTSHSALCSQASVTLLKHLSFS